MIKDRSEQVESLLRHITNVRENCELLGDKLIRSGEEDTGIKLIANGLIHDNSKFYGIEWLYLNQETKNNNKEAFDAALLQHISTNKHHPECWGNINSMPPEYLAEFVCDVKARSEEFGSDITDWIKNKATNKFGFSLKCRVYRDIKGFLEMLLEKWE